MIKHINRITAKVILKIIGWRVTGFNPAHVKKSIVLVVPHTSYWDFPIGILSRNYFNANIKFVGKAELFKGIQGWVTRKMGGIPVIRGGNTTFIEDVVAMFDNAEELCIQIAPEGTRKRVKHLKSGFYRIATQAKVPVILTKFDFKIKEVNFGEPYYLSDDKPLEMKKVEDYFRGTQGKIKENSFL